MAFLTFAKAKVVAPPFVPREQVTMFPQNELKNKNENQYKRPSPSGRGLICWNWNRHRDQTFEYPWNWHLIWNPNRTSLVQRMLAKTKDLHISYSQNPGSGHMSTLPRAAGIRHCNRFGFNL